MGYKILLKYIEVLIIKFLLKIKDLYQLNSGVEGILSLKEYRICG
jgi:hypothetical protein